MRQIKFVVVLVLLLSCALVAQDQLTFSVRHLTSDGPIVREYWSGEILVKFWPMVGPESVRGVVSREIRSFYIFRPLAGTDSGNRSAIQPATLQGYYTLQLATSSPEQLQFLVETLKGNLSVEWVSLSPVFKKFGERPPTNDALVAKQWQFWRNDVFPGAIDWASVQNYKPTRNNIYVIGVDTGGCFGHPDFDWSRNFWNANTIDGKDAIDDNGHGCATMSVVAAKANNALGITGIDDFVRFGFVKALNAQGQANTEWIVKALLLASWKTEDIKSSDPNARVIVNLSFGANDDIPPVAEAIQALRKAGVIVVAAAGNSGINIDRFKVTPASVPGVIAIGACDWNGNVAGRGSWASNWGHMTVLLSAPGQEITVAVPVGAVSNTNLFHPSGYNTLDGTSFAAPHVAGAIALMLDRNPDLSEEQVRLRLANVNRQNDAVWILNDRVYKIDQVFGTGGSLSLKALLSEDRNPPARPVVEVYTIGHSSAKIRVSGISETIIALQYLASHKDGDWQKTILPVSDKVEKGAMEFALLGPDGSPLREDDYHYLIVRIADVAGNWSEWSEWSELIHTRKSVAVPITSLSLRDGPLVKYILQYCSASAPQFCQNAETWHQTTWPSYEGSVWHAGQGLDYRTLGGGSDLELVSNEIHLPISDSISVSFLSLLQMIGAGPQNMHFDIAQFGFEELDDNGKVVSSKILFEDLPNSKDWRELEELRADISQLAGKNVRFFWRFYFMTGSGGIGWVVANPQILLTARE